MFLFAILGYDPAQNLVKIEKVVICANTTYYQKHCDYVIHEQSMTTIQKLCRFKGLPIWFFDIYRHSYYFPLITVIVSLQTLPNVFSTTKSIVTWIPDSKILKEQRIERASVSMAFLIRCKLSNCVVLNKNQTLSQAANHLNRYS